MGHPRPGELVTKRLRWHEDASLVGLVVGHTAEVDASTKNILVLWTLADQRVKFRWHLSDALMVIDANNIAEVRKRCFPAT